MVGLLVAHRRLNAYIEVALRPLPAARLPSHVVVESEQLGGILVRLPEDNGQAGFLLLLTAIYGLLFLIFLGFGARPGWGAPGQVAQVILSILAVLCLVLFLFEGFQTWRLRPGTATIAYGWGGLAKLGFKRVLVDVRSVEYVLEAWDNGAGAWHNVKLVTSGRDPYVIVSRKSEGAVRNQLPISS
jgi:hypothetical protein